MTPHYTCLTGGRKGTADGSLVTATGQVSDTVAPVHELRSTGRSARPYGRCWRSPPLAGRNRRARAARHANL